MKKKLALIIALSLASVGVLSSSAKVAHAADTNVTNKIVMHTATAYDKDGKDTGVTYKAFSYAKIVTNPIKIDDSYYYKVADKDQYLKATNIDGVTRRITHNTYIYSTSTRRTTYQNKWKLYKGQTITTYGGSYRFKNGKRYFRVGGPSKQYVKSYNLGPVVAYNANVKNNATSKEETTVTVTTPTRVITQIDNGYKGTAHFTPVGTQFKVDRLEYNKLSEDSENDDNYYHIKGTNKWINASDVKAAKKLPLHDYFYENFSYITFPKNTEVFNEDGTLQDHDGQLISKQMGHLKVDKLVYIWVPSEKKVELFYHLVGTSFYASTTPTSHWSTINVGHKAYVRASDVKFITVSVKLTPSNTPEEAEAAALKK